MYLLLALFSMNFMLLDKYLIMLMFLQQCVRKKILTCDHKIYLLGAFAAIYTVVLYVFSGKIHVGAVMLPVAYLVGYNWEIEEEDPGKTVKTVLICASLGMCVHVVLNFLWEMIQNRGIVFGARHRDIWSGAVSGATGQMVNLTMCTSVLTFAVMKRGKYLWLLGLLGIGLIYGAIVGSRTAVMMTLVSALAGMLILFGSFRSPNVRKAMVGYAVIVGVLVLVFVNGWFGVSEIVEKSYLLTRIREIIAENQSIFSTSRWDLKGEYLRNAVYWPWGGGKLRQMAGGNYAHDLLLDAFSDGGIFAVGLLAVYLIGWLWDTLAFIRRDGSLEIKVLCFPYLVVMILQMMLEPVIAGAPVLLLNMALVHGVMKQAAGGD